MKSEEGMMKDIIKVVLGPHGPGVRKAKDTPQPSIGALYKLTKI
jgi:hypothetical protein